METTDIHNCHRRFEREKENLAQFKNGEMAIDFLEAMVTYGISVARVSTLAWNVRTILVWKDDKPLTSWAKQDIDFVINQMQKKDWSSDTRERFAFTLKRFLAFVVTKKIIDLNNGDEYPELVDSIRPGRYRRKSDDNSLENRKGFTEEEIMKILEVIPKLTRNGELASTFILVLYEAGLRTHEGLLLKQKQLAFDDKNGEVLITVKSGKSPSRNIPLLLSYRPLLDIITKNPYKDPNTYVFYSTKSNSGHLSYGNLRELIIKACQKVGIQRRSLYKLRHSRGTNLLLSGVDVKTVSKLLGHSSLETTETYLSVINADVRLAVRRERGLEPEEKHEEKMKIIKCHKCGRIESPLSIRCSACSAILDPAYAIKYQQARQSYERKKDDVLTRSVTDLQKVVQQQGKIIQQLLKQKEE